MDIWKSPMFDNYNWVEGGMWQFSICRHLLSHLLTIVHQNRQNIRLRQGYQHGDEKGILCGQVISFRQRGGRIWEATSFYIVSEGSQITAVIKYQHSITLGHNVHTGGIKESKPVARIRFWVASTVLSV